MFARFKTTDGRDVNLVPYKVSSFFANSDGSTTIIGEQISVTVQESTRKVRSTLSKLMSAGEEYVVEAEAPSAPEDAAV